MHRIASEPWHCSHLSGPAALCTPCARPQIKLELKVGRNNSREKGVVEESKKLRATTLVLGTNTRGMFTM